MTQDNTELLPVTQEDIAIALEHLGYDSVDDLHYWAENDTELRRFDELCSRFARHRLNTRPTQGHDALVDALTLAANRLDMCVVDAIADGEHKRSCTYKDWAEEARKALSTIKGEG